jgi:hemerythrin-like metal-binding protein
MGFAWQDRYRVGVREIDEQHKRLFGMIDAFYGALGAGQPAKPALGALLSGLLDYTRYHFSCEEQLMLQTAFPMARSHRAQHAAFVAKVSDMRERYVSGHLVLSIEATGFLREWLSSHILVLDRQLGDHLTGRKAASAAEGPQPVEAIPDRQED